MHPMDGSGQRRLVYRTLLALAGDRVEPELLAECLEVAPQELTEAAVSQGMGPALAAAVPPGYDVGPSVRNEVQEARFAAAATRDVLGHVDTVLAEAGVTWVALKGAVVASRYRRPELRTWRDVDLLVDGGSFGRAMDALDEAGIADVNRNWRNYLDHGVAETPLWAPGIGIDLHWHVVALARTRTRTDVDIAGMLSRRRRVPVGPVDVWTLDATDLLLHSLLHAALAGGSRLVWLRDVRELIRSDPPDWSVFVERVRPTGLAGPVAQVLDRARCLLGAEVPVDVATALCPGPLLAARERVDRLEGGRHGLPERIAPGSPIRMSGGPGLREVLVSLGRFLPTLWRRGEDWNVGSPDGPLYWDRPSGGPDDRAAYLDYARREAEAVVSGGRADREGER